VNDQGSRPWKAHLAIALGFLAVTISVCEGVEAQGSGAKREFQSVPSNHVKASGASGQVTTTTGRATMSPVDPPSYLPWYTSPPSAISGAYVSIGGAWGAGNLYNTSTEGSVSVGTAMLDTGQCSFICFGGPSDTSHHYLAYGNDVNPPSLVTAGTSFTHHGAADDCQFQGGCPGGIHNQVFGTTVMVSPLPSPSNDAFFVTLDGYGRFAEVGNLYAGAAVIAGAGVGTPAPIPSPSSGSLVSYTGTGEGDVLLGSSGDYIKCDFGETLTAAMTCGAPLRSAVSATATPGTVGPCYKHDGNSCETTFHFVKHSSALGITTATSCLNGTWCSLSNATISLSGSNAQFSNGQYSCALSSTSAYLINLSVNGQTTSSFIIQAFNSSGSAIAAAVDLGVTYACFGV
jgi:hypothetical protein